MAKNAVESLRLSILSFSMIVLLSSCGEEHIAEVNDRQQLPTANPAMTNTTIPKVKVVVVQNNTIGAQIELTGRLKALRTISVVPEVQGKILRQKKELDPGVAFRQGETLLQIESTQTDLNLYAMRAKFASQIMSLLSDLEADYPDAYPKWKAYTDDFDYQKELPQLPVFDNSREQYLFNLKNIPGQYLDIKAQEDQLSKYQIQAPFAGVVLESSVDYGDVVTPGKPIATFLGTDRYEFETAVSEQDLAYLQMEDQVELIHTNNGKTYTGRVVRTGGVVDENTQTIPVFIEVQGSDLKQGIYLEGQIAGEPIADVALISSELITRNSEVHIIKNNTIELLAIQRLGSVGSKAIVRGIPDGSLVVDQVVSTATLRGKVKPVRRKMS